MKKLVGAEVRKERQRIRVSLEKLSADARVPLTSLCYFERSTRRLKKQQEVRLARALAKLRGIELKRQALIEGLVPGQVAAL